ncbi:MAG: phosphatidylserine/phosphatidylglycerophosphate/cardiolipin synthase family protein [Bdellovibrionales bacterium]|nr:phosphatidylserine/phosphatidylglycerophosphate/cardiolipin synthase family protein [Bdellovibrionales bacterium]
MLAFVLTLLFLHAPSAEAGGGARIVPQAGAVRDPQWFSNQAVGGNQIELLLDGRATERARRRLIRDARQSILVSAYGIGADESGDLFMRRLCAASQRGVDVRLIFDPWGSTDIYGYMERLRNCGIVVIRYNGSAWGLEWMLNSLHEKLLIVDGQKVLVGGSGYMNMYRDASRESEEWHDLDSVIEGPAACRFYRSYLAHWQHIVFEDLAARDTCFMGSGCMSFQRKERLYGLSRRLPDCEERSVGHSNVIPLHNTPAMRSERPTRTAYAQAIATADRRILLTAPYFVPEELFVAELLEARARGVEVHVITNSRDSNDADPAGLVTYGMYKRARPLLEAGVHIHLWNGPGTIHRKAGVFDDRWAYLGSDNLDARAIHQNTETIAFMDEASVVRTLDTEFTLDLERTTLLSLEQIDREVPSFPWWVRAAGDIAVGYY